MKYRVIYWVKDTEKRQGLLIEMTKSFNVDNDAIEFIKGLRNRDDLISVPLLEVI